MHHALRPLRRQQWHQRSDTWILSPCDLHLSDKRHTKPKHKSKNTGMGAHVSLIGPRGSLSHPSPAKMLIHRLGMSVLTCACQSVWGYWCMWVEQLCLVYAASAVIFSFVVDEKHRGGISSALVAASALFCFASLPCYKKKKDKTCSSIF